jgi:hypothetical protein
MFLKLNEFETGRTVRVNVSNILFYKTIRVRSSKNENSIIENQIEATGLRFENDPIMLVVKESVEEIDTLLKQSYHFIK